MHLYIFFVIRPYFVSGVDFTLCITFLFLAVILNMSSNGSNDTQLGRLDSMFGSQGSTRNFTSLLNPSYLQSPNGKESHKRETDGKYLNLLLRIFIKALWRHYALVFPSQICAC